MWLITWEPSVTLRSSCQASQPRCTTTEGSEMLLGSLSVGRRDVRGWDVAARTAERLQRIKAVLPFLTPIPSVLSLSSCAYAQMCINMMCLHIQMCKTDLQRSLKAKRAKRR